MHAEDGGNLLSCDLSGWPKRAKECTQQGQQEDFKQLLPREL